MSTNLSSVLARLWIATHVIILSEGAIQRVNGQVPVLTLTNPAPALSETFGQTVALIGNQLLVANPRDQNDAGSVSLYSSNGVLIRTFQNPARANGEFFGHSLTIVGSDKVLIGAPLSSPPPVARPGAAYLFHTNGTLLRTFRRPTPQPAATFGFSVATIDDGRVAIGAPSDDRAAQNGGAVYVFSTNGSLLATITNDLPATDQGFGAALATLWPDRLIIGAPGSAGTACLMTTNGSLLRRYRDPNGLVDSGFGSAVAALGRDRLVITAPSASIEAPFAGGANIFDTNGLILAPLVNPDPDFLDAFGSTVAVVDGDKIFVGSVDQRNSASGGAAYLYATNGTLLMTIDEPVAEFSRLGGSIADLGLGRVLIGAHGLNFVGAAYVYDLAPTLQITSDSPATVSISWPSAWSGWLPEQNASLGLSDWTPIAGTINDDGIMKSISIPNESVMRMFRLKRH